MIRQLLSLLFDHARAVADRVIRGPRALTIVREDDALVLMHEPGGRRLGARANLPRIGRVSLSPTRRHRRRWSPLPMPDPAELVAAIERGQRRARDERGGTR